MPKHIYLFFFMLLSSLLPASLLVHGADGEVSTRLGESTVVNLQIESQSQANQPNVPLTFGHVFAEGDIPTGQTVIGRLADGQTIPLQVDGVATHHDGSLRYGVITGILPTLAANENKTLQLLSRTEAEPSGDISLNDLLATDFDAELTINLAGTLYSAEARALLQADGATASKWLDGPLVTEWQLSSPIKTASGTEHPHLVARFYVRAYQGLERIRVDVIVENNWSFVEQPRNYDYDASITVGGTEVFQKTFATPSEWAGDGYNNTSSDYPHFHHARWRKTFWWGAEPEVYLRHDANYLINSRALPNYDATQSVAESALVTVAERWQEEKTHPMGIGLASPYMPGTGQRWDIGPFPDWAALYLLSMDERAKEATLGTGDLAGSWSIHYRDQATDLPVSLDDYPDLSTHMNLSNRGPLPVPRCANGDNTLCDTPYVHDQAHQPSLVYLPYLVTGDYYYLEELHFWANRNVFYTDPSYRGFEKGWVKFQQVRGQAWSLRTLGQAAYITPNNHPLKSYFVARVGYNLEWYLSEYVNTNELGVHPRTNYENGRAMAPWQDDFFTWSVGYLVELGFLDAKPLLEWKAKFPVGRMIAPGFCWIRGAAYNLIVRDSADAPIYTTFAEVYQASAPELLGLACGSQEMGDALDLAAGEMTGYSAVGHGFPSQMQPALAVAYDSGIPGADEAYSVFMNRSVKPDYSLEPRYNILPRFASTNTSPVGDYMLYLPAITR